MNAGLEFFGIVVCLIGCGFFAFAAYTGETVTEDKITRVIKRDKKNQYIYGFFTFVTFIVGVTLLGDISKLF